jgi:hypothetical protein
MQNMKPGNSSFFRDTSRGYHSAHFKIAKPSPPFNHSTSNQERILRSWFVQSFCGARWPQDAVG